MKKLVNGKKIKMTQDEIDEYNARQPSNEDILNNKKEWAINNRKKYLQNTDWYASRSIDNPESYPDEVKQKRILARTEINQIEQETNIDNIVVDFD